MEQHSGANVVGQQQVSAGDAFEVMNMGSSQKPRGPIATEEVDDILYDPDMDIVPQSDPAAPGAVLQTPAAQEPAVQQAAAPLNENASGAPEFSVILSVAEGQKIGLAVDYSDQETFFVNEVRPGGAVEAWNVSNPRLQVCQGMRVIAINGIRAKAESMLPEFVKTGKVDMLVRRCQCASGEFAVVLPVAAGQIPGLSCDWSDLRTFYISQVKPDGAAAAWNLSAEPQLQVAPGMRIVEINGVQGSPEKMLREFKKEGSVHLILRRASES